MHVRVFLALLALPLVFPLVGADTEQGATVGANLGYVMPGLWDVWEYHHAAAGSASFGLTWAASTPPMAADYDLHLYPRSALNDGQLTTDERIAHSSTRAWSPRAESISLTLPAGRYYVAIVPFQAQGEVYTLTSNPGQLTYATTAPGFLARCPPYPC